MRIEKARPTVCSHCHKELGQSELAACEAPENENQRYYCTNCAPIATLQQSWRPLGRGTVQAMYQMDRHGNIISRNPKRE